MAEGGGSTWVSGLRLVGWRRIESPGDIHGLQ